MVESSSSYSFGSMVRAESSDGATTMIGDSLASFRLLRLEWTLLVATMCLCVSNEALSADVSEEGRHV